MLRIYLTLFLLHAVIALAWAGPSDQETVVPESSTPFAVAYLDPESGADIQTLVRQALERNAGLIAVRQRLREVQGLLRQARLLPNPGLDISYGRGSVLGSPGEEEFSIGYAHTFLLGGKRARRVEVARILADMARYEVADAERRLIADVRATYVETLAAIRNVQTIEELLTVNGRAVALVRLRVAHGESPRLDETLLQVEMNRLRADRARLQSQVMRQILRLKQLVGMNPDDPLRIRGQLQLPDTWSHDVSEQTLIRYALEQRPDLRIARLNETLAEAELRLARAEAYPDLVGFIRYTRSRARFDALGLNAQGQRVPLVDTDHILTFGIAINLPLWNRNQGNIEAARARLHAARQQRAYLEQIIAREVTAAWTRFRAASRALRIFDREVLRQARENFRIVRAAYELGELRMLDVITEQRRLIQVQREYTDVLKEFHLARIELDRVLGAPFTPETPSREDRHASLP